MSKNEVALTQDTSNWIAILKREAEEKYVLQSIQAINSMEDDTKKKVKGNNVLLKSVHDELKDVMSSKIGMIHQRIEQEIQDILMNKALDIKEKQSKIAKLIWEDIEHLLNPNLYQLFQLLREKVWKVKSSLDSYYFTLENLIDNKKRAITYADTKFFIMDRLELEYLKYLSGNNLNVYDATDWIEQIVNSPEKEIIDRIVTLLRGSKTRKKRNRYDKLHLLSCVSLSREKPSSIVLFSTKDTAMLRNAEKNSFNFLIVALEKTPEFIMNMKKELART